MIADPLAHRHVASLQGLRPLFDQLREALGSLLAFGDNLQLTGVPEFLTQLDEALDILPDVADLLAECAGADEALYALAVSRPWRADELEAGILRLALNRLYRTQRGLARITDRNLQASLKRMRERMQDLQEQNATSIIAGVHQRFRHRVAKASQPAAQLTAEEKEWKKRYTRGRKELEHEFGKVMRYKSIRSLSADETGEVLGDLKPVWLMSPHSVSDTLPLDPQAFDMVVFDEASQITLEEAVPALFRQPRPSWSAMNNNYRPPASLAARAVRTMMIPMTIAQRPWLCVQNSFLNHAARTLKATMLGWHYRSRYEALIDFSNASFYYRRLLTIPDVSISREREAITVSDPTAPTTVETITDRPVSFHHLPEGVYEKRRNSDEARYISEILFTVLRDRPRLVRRHRRLFRSPAE